jgi:hypothetical protein
VVYEIVASCFKEQHKGYVAVHPLVFAHYLEFACAYRCYNLSKCESELQKWADTIPRIHETYRMTSHNMLAYCLVVLGKYKLAAGHVMTSLHISAELSNAATHYLEASVSFCTATPGTLHRQYPLSYSVTVMSDGRIVNQEEPVMSSSYSSVLEGMVRHLRDIGNTRETDIMSKLPFGESEYADKIQEYMTHKCINELVW